MFGWGARRRARARCPRREGEQVTLDSLQVGERAILLAVNGDRSLRRRMMEMGLLEGSRLRISKSSPSGDPLEIKINDYYLSIRRCDAANIIVSPLGEDHHHFHHHHHHRPH